MRRDTLGQSTSREPLGGCGGRRVLQDASRLGGDRRAGGFTVGHNDGGLFRSVDVPSGLVEAAAATVVTRGTESQAQLTSKFQMSDLQT